ncbi:hypothetical protein RN001_007363 [Aquatica leii]|uniref:Jumonji domain-containing protein 4 n=1 Tax=Aquatica leii TaxID=1421715 RepID=A0AAN7PY24_9COLE|nr:hypothetical protein RN001_007363 [Aquatica leii]
MEVEINNTYLEIQDFPTVYHEFPIIDSDISYTEFFEKYFLRNQACLIRNVSNNWESSKFWVNKETPNFTNLEQSYGDLEVNVVDCKGKMDYSNQKPLKWTFKEYVEYWKNYKECAESLPVLYLKDWHLKNQMPKDNFYEVPLYFACDWLNEYLVDNSFDDYRFVYMGVNGTWSPFHVDVMTSYSWSTNICGQKKWVLFPPGEEKYLTDPFGNLPNDIDSVKHDRKYFEVVQNAGDAIFVPSNWHHQVWNIKNTISINHNWFNGCNLHVIWQSMEKNLCEVKEEISDCNDMDNFLDHCQIMLKASFSLDFKDFFDIINYIAKKRLKFLNGGPIIRLTDKYTLGKYHSVFDLVSIKAVLIKLINHADLDELNFFKILQDAPLNLLSEIEDCT